MLNWIVWNETVFNIETLLILNWIVWSQTVLTFVSKQNLYLYETESAELELFD